MDKSDFLYQEKDDQSNMNTRYDKLQFDSENAYERDSKEIQVN